MVLSGEGFEPQRERSTRRVTSVCRTVHIDSHSGRNECAWERQVNQLKYVQKPPMMDRRLLTSGRFPPAGVDRTKRVDDKKYV